jgi:hypothetical protein
MDKTVDMHRKMRIQMDIGGRRVIWNAKLTDVINGTVFKEEVIAVDELTFDTVPSDAIADAKRVGSAVEAVFCALSEHMPARIMIDVTNYNHDEWETETLQ